MFEAIATGLNEAYGIKGQKIKIGDAHVLRAMQMGWITPQSVKYVGHWKLSENKGKEIPAKKVIIFPEKQVYLTNELDLQSSAMERIQKEIKLILRKHEEMKKLLLEKSNGK